MKVRKQNISFLKSGSGSLNSRIMLPITWVRELGLSQEEREVYIYQIGEEIVIRKTPMNFDKKEAAKIAFEEVKQIILTKQYIEHVEIIEIIKTIIDSYFFNIEEKERNDKVVALVSVLRDSFLDKKYEFVLDNKKQYFFDKEKYNFKTVEELEKYFQISHEKI
ncbi:hypothetical protein [Fusobacterium sp.]|mgnify:FL=1|uniref:hypothetical protein n=1 Tax=Fusobacterium sp. TaxID=68766 RepID=UPI0015A719D3|nr:hypothetical protein [Fusobacterium sp.]MEE1475571.1 hypothetical protein [Fusobacterium sp.]